MIGPTQERSMSMVLGKLGFATGQQGRRTGISDTGYIEKNLIISEICPNSLRVEYLHI